MFAKLKPFKVQFTGTAARLDCMAIVKLGGFADVEMRLSSKEGAVLWTGMARMDGDDYSQWTDDDAHVFEWAAAKLGCEIESVEPDPEPVFPSPVSPAIDPEAP